MQRKSWETQSRLIERCVQKRSKKECFDELIEENEDAYEREIELLKMPRRKSWKDAIASEHLGIIDGGKGYQ